MSRCFPYPPPGYVGSKASNAALIESIKVFFWSSITQAVRNISDKEHLSNKDVVVLEEKLQREKAKAERKKEKKREKKEKREKEKVKKDDSKQYPNGTQAGKSEKSDGPDVKDHRSLTDSKGIFKEQIKEVVDEQMERSGLTEEHELPVAVQKPSLSSDSTETSNKRKRSASPLPNGGGVSGYGNVIRIRLPMGKHKELNSVKESICRESICSTSGATGSSATLSRDSHVQVPRTADNKLICSASGSDQELAPVDVPMPSALTAFEKELESASLLYKELVGRLVSPATTGSELLDLDEDQEWLFGRKQVEKRHKPSTDLSCRGSSSLLQPCAQFLPEVGTYALPYTLPF